MSQGHYLHLPDDLYPGGDGELGLLLLPPEQEVVVGEGVFPVQQQVHQVIRHLAGGVQGLKSTI